MIQVQNLKKSFGAITAVNDISFEIRPGETFGLLGPNGAGKSTAINLMVGLLKPDSGKVTIDGSEDPTQLSVRKKVGVSPQALAIYEELTAEENLRFFGRTYDITTSRLKERVEFCLQLSGLEKRRKDIVGTFSGGMKRRLNLVCALLHEARYLFFDEPTVGVDPQSRNLIFDNIELLRKEGHTIIYTTHYMEEAQRLCDRVAIIDEGKILALDKVDNLIAAHGGQAVITAELASAPDNTKELPGKLEGLTLKIETDKPMEMLAQLNHSGLSFRTLHVDQADLEKVFLNLTGRRLRDE